MYYVYRSKWVMEDDLITGEVSESPDYDLTNVGSFNSLEDAMNFAIGSFIADIKCISEKAGDCEIRFLPLKEDESTLLMMVRVCEIIKGDKGLGYYVTEFEVEEDL